MDAGKWVTMTDKEIVEMASECETQHELARKCGLKRPSQSFRKRVLQLPLVYSERKPRHSKEEFFEAVSKSKSIKDVIVNLGYKTQGSRYDLVNYLSKLYEIPLPEYSKSEESKEHLTKIRRKMSDEEYFSSPSYRSGATTRSRMIKMGIDYHCSVLICPLNSGELIWNGLEIVLQVDHKDGDKQNNHLSNLRFLCPNCHSQTPTYAGRSNNPESVQYKHFEEHSI